MSNKCLKNVAPVTEIILGMLTDGLDSAEKAGAIMEPKDFILSRVDMNVGDIDISIVENDSDTMNLVLPYYSLVDTGRTANMALDDEELSAVVGGEVLTELERQGMNIVKEGVYRDGGGLNGAGVLGHAIAEQQRFYLLRAQGLSPEKDAGSNDDSKNPRQTKKDS